MAIIIIAGFLAYHTGSWVSPNKAQLISIATMSVIIILFVLKNVGFKLLYWFGFYSYEIYLFHWPLLYRYDVFYKFLPAWIATVFYLVFFIGLAWGFKNLSKVILKKLIPKT
jgi:membrane-bound acyltransferase YfiQ involved in biofilm formation